MVERNEGKRKREQMLSSMTAAAYRRLLAQAGWLETLSPAQIRALKTELQREYVKNPVTAWQALAALSFDAETVYEATADGLSYPALLRALSTASGGRFVPIHISCHLEAGEWYLHFTVNGKSYSFVTTASTDYFDTDLLSVVNLALQDAGSPYRFSVLPADDQIIHIAFTRPETIAASVGQNLIPAPPE